MDRKRSVKSAGCRRGNCSKPGGVPKVALPKTSKLPFDADALLKNAAEPNRNGLTNAGRALQKHANRAGEELSTIKFSGKTANQDAQKIIEKILNNPSTVVKDIEKGGYILNRNEDALSDSLKIRNIVA